MLPNPFLDDLAKLATSAGGALLEWRKEVEHICQQVFDKMAIKMQLVSREEFEIVREMATKARAENEALKACLAVLEQNNRARHN